MQDTGHILFNAFGCGTEQRELLDAQIKSGERSFRDVSEEMWGSLNVPFADGFEAMKEGLDIDPEFKNFHQFCLNQRFWFNKWKSAKKCKQKWICLSFFTQKIPNLSSFSRLIFYLRNAETQKEKIQFVWGPHSSI